MVRLDSLMRDLSKLVNEAFGLNKRVYISSTDDVRVAGKILTALRVFWGVQYEQAWRNEPSTNDEDVNIVRKYWTYCQNRHS